ncbi:hypothetical protein [Vibrio maerlii]|uniref:hypothetical protein n=1 Tax=Vibrio maerlii TaxID=2231648 RepID=UPI001F13A4E5|nr:hypothetical protein [Vibrio maerlii]
MTFPAMLFGAQLILTLVLVKGDICPGQRGRVHKMIPLIAFMWMTVVSLKLEALLVVFALTYFFSQVQISKTRDKGPLWALHLANGLGISFVFLNANLNSTYTIIFSVLQILWLGAVFGQLMLIVARSRLQAFHRILPVSGIISSTLIVIVTAVYAAGLTDEQIAIIMQPFLIMFALLVLTNVIWCWHLLTRKEVHKVQIGVAVVSAIATVVVSQSLYVV